MKPKQTILIFAVLVIAVFVLGCARPPVDEMNQAVEAVTRAENDINAVTYAANSVARARDALARMHAEADAKRYDSARNFAAEALAAAVRAIDEGRTGANRARDNAAALISELRPLITETDQGINAARAAGLPLDYDSLGRDFDAARQNADQAQAALTAGRFDESIDQSRTARASLNGINQQLSGAALAASRSK